MGKIPILTSIFFKGVETTNKYKVLRVDEKYVLTPEKNKKTTKLHKSSEKKIYPLVNLSHSNGWQWNVHIPPSLNRVPYIFNSSIRVEPPFSVGEVMDLLNLRVVDLGGLLTVGLTVDLQKWVGGSFNLGSRYIILIGGLLPPQI